MEKRFRRRQYFIDRKFQANFIIKFCVIVILASIVFGMLTLYLSRNYTTVAIENTRVNVKSASDFMFPIMVQTLLIVNLVSAVCVVFLTLLVSHKISGPLYRIKKELELLKTGDLAANFRIRTNDQLQELSQDLVETTDFLRDKQKKLLEKTNKIKEIIAKSPASADDEVKKVLNEIDNIISHFKI